MPLALLAQMGKEALPMLVREDDLRNKVLALREAGLVRALESEDQDEVLICLTDKGRQALSPSPGDAAT